MCTKSASTSLSKYCRRGQSKHHYRGQGIIHTYTHMYEYSWNFILDTETLDLTVISYQNLIPFSEKQSLRFPTLCPTCVWQCGGEGNLSQNKWNEPLQTPTVAIKTASTFQVFSSLRMLKCLLTVNPWDKTHSTSWWCASHSFKANQMNR